MICIHPFFFWMLTLLAVPGVVLGGFAGWFLIEWFRIYWLGKR